MNIEVLKDLRHKLVNKFNLANSFLDIDLIGDIFIINWSCYNDAYINYDKDVYPLVKFCKKYLKKHNQTGFFYDAVYSHKVEEV